MLPVLCVHSPIPDALILGSGVAGLSAALRLLDKGARVVLMASIYTSIYLSIYLSVCLYLSIYLSIFLSIYLSIYLSVYPSIYLSIRLCGYLYLSGFLSIHPGLTHRADGYCVHTYTPTYKH